MDTLSCPLPSADSLPCLSVGGAIKKHAAAAHTSSTASQSASAQALTAALTSAAIKHIFFARGQICATVAQLQKQARDDEAAMSGGGGQSEERRPTGARNSRTKNRKRQEVRMLYSVEPGVDDEIGADQYSQLLSALRRLDECVEAALSRPGPSREAGALNLLLIFGPSPLSPFEVYHMAVRTPTNEDVCEANDQASRADGILPSKALANLERKLVRFLISTDELQQSFEKQLRPTKMHILTYRSKDWACPGWRMRRGFKVDLRGLFPPDTTAEEEKDEPATNGPAADASVGVTPRPDTIPSGSGGTTTAMQSDGNGVESHPGASLSATCHPADEDINVLSQALSPLKKRTFPPRPTLLSRTSSGFSLGSRVVDSANTPRRRPENVATPRPRPFSIWASPGVVDSPVSKAASQRSRVEQSDRTVEEQASRLPFSALCNANEPYGRSQPTEGSSLAQPKAPTASTTNTAKPSLLSKHMRRVGTKEGAGGGTGRRPVAKRKFPKGAAFCLDCHKDSDTDASRDPVDLLRARDTEGCWFQCEVTVPSFV